MCIRDRTTVACQPMKLCAEMRVYVWWCVFSRKKFTVEYHWVAFSICTPKEYFRFFFLFSLSHLLSLSSKIFFFGVCMCMCFDFFLLNALCAHKDRRSEEWLQKSRKKRTTNNTSGRNECFQSEVDMFLEIYLDSWDHKLNENFYLLYLCIISFLLLAWVTQAP